jgi:hypothetical protein
VSNTNLELTRIAGAVSIARLHGRACWHCGAVARTMRPAGRVQRTEGGRVWTVYSCGCDKEAAAS